MSSPEQLAESREHPLTIIAEAIRNAYDAPPKDTVFLGGRGFPVQNAAMHALALAQARSGAMADFLKKFRDGLPQ